jgi:hypothetical protein
MDISFFRQYNPNTGKFHWAFPYEEEEHPRQIRGLVTDHELDQFRKERLQPRKSGGPDRSTNEIFPSPTTEELTVVREWVDRVLQDAHSASPFPVQGRSSLWTAACCWGGWLVLLLRG